MSEIQDDAYSEAMDEIQKLGDKVQYLEGQIEELKNLCIRAVHALDHESWISEEQCGLSSQFCDLIDELRKAAE